MSSDDSSVTTAMMTPWLHFTGGDFVFFKTITPTSKGAMAGAAIFLFALAVFERFIVAIRSVKEAEWRHKYMLSLISLAFTFPHILSHHRTRVLLAARAASKDNKSLHADQRRRSIPPFIVSHDLARGVLHAFQALIHFALMLAVMYEAHSKYLKEDGLTVLLSGHSRSPI